MIETTIRDPEKQETLRADSQGRVNLGVEYADRVVELVVVESEAESSAEAGVQQTIGDRPMSERERTGTLFARAFGLDPAFLNDPERVEADAVRGADIDWSEGYLLGRESVARFGFEEPDDGPGFEELLTAEPESVSADGDTYGAPVYCYENEAGDVSAVAQSLVERAGRVFGYDPTEDLAHVRVHPEAGDHPVLFRDPAGETYIAIAPRIAE